MPPRDLLQGSVSDARDTGGTSRSFRRSHRCTNKSRGAGRLARRIRAIAVHRWSKCATQETQPPPRRGAGASRAGATRTRARSIVLCEASRPPLYCTRGPHRSAPSTRAPSTVGAPSRGCGRGHALRPYYLSRRKTEDCRIRPVSRQVSRPLPGAIACVSGTCWTKRRTSRE
jgi:hypothetical protein